MSMFRKLPTAAPTMNPRITIQAGITESSPRGIIAELSTAHRSKQKHTCKPESDSASVGGVA
jgi:hypothetical protein